jgi:hypothetical protein
MHLFPEKDRRGGGKKISSPSSIPVLSYLPRRRARDRISLTGKRAILMFNAAKSNFHQLNRAKAIARRIPASGVAHSPWKRIDEAAE